MINSNRSLIFLGFAGAAVVLILVAVASFRTVRRAEATNAAVVRTHEVLTALETVITATIDAETGARGYELTGNDSYLKPLRDGETMLPRAVARVASLTTDNDAQQARLQDVRAHIADTLALLHEAVARRQAGQPVPDALREHQKRGLDAIREGIADMRREEEGLLNARTAIDETVTRRTRGLFATVIVVAFVLLGGTLVLLDRNAVALQRLNASLEAHVAARTAELEQALGRERDARREAQAANRLKDEFLMTVSHELRTPLNSILGWSRMLATGEIREEQKRRAIDAVQRSAEAQTQLVNDLLDVSRAISGKLRLNLKSADVALVVGAAVDAVQPAADAKGVAVEIVMDDRAGVIAADPDRLQQVIWNLLSNAVKFTPKGGRVEARVVRDEAHVEITVADTGAGISADFLPFVFDRFRQAEGGTTRGHGGLGLGLAIVRHLVELHGGHVSAESAGEGKGATFHVTLPVTTPGAAAAPSHETAPAVARQRLNAVRVLVVDDELRTCELLTAILEHAGAEVRCACSAAEAMAVLEAWTPDLLLSDIAMPHEDGYSLIEKVNALFSARGDRIASVAVTANVGPEDRIRALQSGFHWHLSKPFEPEELVAVAASLTSRRVMS